MYELKELATHKPVDVHGQRRDNFSVIQDGIPVASIVFHLTAGTLYLHHIEVFKKRRGTGRKVIEFLFQHFQLTQINGFVLCDETAYNFWHRLGAVIYFIDVEGYADGAELVDAGIESPFCLTKEKITSFISA